MGYREIDDAIEDWAHKHQLVMHTSSGGRSVRAVYVSSLAGECFQIWIEAPVDGKTIIYACCLEGRMGNQVPAEWQACTTDVAMVLELVWRTVIGWMAPSERYLPEGWNIL